MKNVNVANAEEIKIVRCNRLGSQRSGQKPRLIIAKYHWYGDRMEVWSKRRNLKGSDIYLSEKYPPEIETRQKLLYPIVKEAWK